LERPIRVLVVDDYGPWRQFVCSTLQQRAELQIIGEVADGLEAVHKSRELQPDLILLDVGLPTLNGIEAARRIRQLSGKSKILFTSGNRSAEVVTAALGTGAVGYVLKFNAVNELLPAVDAVLEGRQFVSANLTSDDLTLNMDSEGANPVHEEPASSGWTRRGGAENTCRHEVAFYSDDLSLLHHLTKSAAAALTAGNAVIVIATESHRDSLLRGLRAQGPDIVAAIERGRYVALDGADVLSKFMCSATPDPARFLKLFRDFIEKTAEAEKGRPTRVIVLGECAALLWAEGNPEAAIQVEKLANQLVREYDVDILCGYSLGGREDGIDSDIFERICREHSAVSSH
jgi:DNA-binding NarL/FixJ family response regulator